MAIMVSLCTLVLNPLQSHTHLKLPFQSPREHRTNALPTTGVVLIWQ